jgi:TolB-like protein/Tfp pilus assembly protein PilF/predicted Ser/Thr protein kinase
MGELIRGEFELGRRLGGGAEGEVYEAVSVKTGRKVAVKILNRARGGPAFLESARKLMGQEGGPYPAVLEAFEDAGRIVVAMELLDGSPLREVLGAGDLSEGRRRALAGALIDAVRELHRRGLAHGDLSPDNVFVADGEARLIDPRITTPKPAGAVMGTANFAAPETLHFGGVANAGGDVFSLSALLYLVFEGKDPFGCQSPEEYLIKAGARSLSARPFEKTPKSYRRLISSGLALDPRARPKTVAALAGLRESAARRGRAAALAVGSLLLAFGGWRWLSGKTAGLETVAVLPFVDEDRDPETEYLSDGLTETIINELAQSKELKVSARCSVLRYKGTADPLAAAEALGVRHVATGRVRRRGESVVVSVELLDAGEKKQLWGERYDRKASAALEVQKSISRRIAESLRAKITANALRRPAQRGTENPEAYQAYLKGRYYWNRRTAVNIGKALEEFQRAVDADPGYALAYVGLADAYAVQPHYAGASAAETLPKARAAATRALEIDDALSEAHASMGYIDMMQWKFDDADGELRRANELNPNNSIGHQWYAIYLHAVGDLDGAIAETVRARELDPLSPIISVQVCNLHLLKGELDTAVNECRKVLELDEKFPRAHELLAWAYLKKGRADEAIAEYRKSVEFSGRASQELGNLGYGLGRAGRRAEAEKVLAELEDRYAQRRTPAMYPAAVLAGMGEKDRAFAWLEKDLAAGAGGLFYTAYFPIYDTLWDDPRFPDLLRRMKLNRGKR